MASLEARIDKYLSIETAGGASWSPEGDKIAFAYNAPGVYQIYKADIKSNRIMQPERLTSGEDRCTDPRWLKDGSILFTSDAGGNENFQIGLIETDKSVRWLTHDREAKYRPNFHSDNHLYYQSNTEDKSRLDIFRWQLPLGDYKPEKIREPETGIEILQCTHESDIWAIAWQYRGNNDQDLILISLDDFESRNLTAGVSTGPTRWQATRFLDDENLLVITDHQSDIARFATLGIDGSFSTIDGYEEKVEWEVESTAWNYRNPFTYFTENKEGYSSVYRARFEEGVANDLEALELPIEGVLVSGDARSFTESMELSQDGNHLALTLSSSTEPTNIWILETDTQRSWRATDTDTHGLKRSDFAAASLHRFSSFDGLSVPYFKYVPLKKDENTQSPCIFIIHGGPESQSRPSFSPIIQCYLSAGYAVVTPNIRGSTGYGRTYMDSDNVEKRLDSIADIKSLADHLESKDKSIDNSRLVIYGGSYGGFAVLSSITEYPEMWRAAVDIVGISNFVTFLQNTADWRRSLREAEYGNLEHDRDTLERVSPIHKVDRISCPLFIIQGDNDERVPLSESIQIYEKVKEKGIDVRLLRFADEGHGLAKLENRLKAYSEILDWLNRIV